jgi:hypothetical protein
VVISIDGVSEQIGTDSGKKDGQNFTDVSPAAALSGGICLRGFLSRDGLGLVFGLVWGFRMAMEPVACVESLVVVAQPGVGIGFVALALLLIPSHIARSPVRLS